MPQAARPTDAPNPPFALEGIDHVLLLTADMAATRRFYEGVLGCAFETAYPEYGMAMLRAGAALIAFVDVSTPEGAWAVPEAAGGRNMDHLCLALGRHDATALRRHLAGHAVEIIEESTHAGARGTSLSLYVRDPSGHVLELKGPPVD
jgi:catechol 2,3-dioxygenase-like lactoylglutathione lyase family enzyme